MYDFLAERADELEAKAGDAVTIVAQSNREWFVAKHVGRLGKPGLIPISFVQVRDPVTNKPIADVDTIIDSGALPRVEDWKKQLLDYKANSISLGKLDSPVPFAGGLGSPTSDIPPLQQQNFSAPSSNSGGSESDIIDDDTPQKTSIAVKTVPRTDSLTVLPEGLLLTASITGFHYENEDYWFRIRALYQPFDSTGTHSLPPARDLTLFRVYNDFFDFQTTLLKIFPAESGQQAQPRILPFMPGPAEHVDEVLTTRRKDELDDYVQRLCRLNKTRARYVLEDTHVRSFFAARPGDLDKRAGPQFETMSELNWYDPVDEPEVMHATPDGGVPPSPVADVLMDRFGDLSMDDRRGDESDGSDYGEEPAAERGYANGYANGHRQHLHAPSMSVSSRTPSPRGHVSRPSQGKNNYSNGRDSAYSSNSSGSRWRESGQNSHSTHATSPTSSTSKTSLNSSGNGGRRSRATSNAAAMPPISASNPQPAFVKIKVFDKMQDDLIALRVHPRVQLADLRDKVQQRLGGSITLLSYRASVSGGDSYVALHDDEDLLIWIESTDRHVLYAN
jgi:bud emergence protein 1